MRRVPRGIRYERTERLTTPPGLKASTGRSLRTDGFRRSRTAFAELLVASTSSRTKLTSEPVSEVCAANDSCR